MAPASEEQRGQRPAHDQGHERAHAPVDTHEHAHPSHGHHDHSHAYAHAGHAHDASQRRLLAALVILGLFTLVEAVGGYFAHSIALLAEAAHMLADCASLLLAIVAFRVGRRPADQRRTYGHRRYQPLAAFINGQLLLLLTAWVVYEACLRLWHRPAIDARLMLGVAIAGGIANLASFIALSGGASLNERGARAHVLSDLLGSLAASVAAAVILVSGWTLADPVLSLVVSALVLRSGWRLMRESADVLLESAPRGFDIHRIEAELIRQVPGVAAVHDVHVWSITGERPMVTLHAQLHDGIQGDDALAAIHSCLRETLEIEHVTVQIEAEGRCESACAPL